MIEYILGAGIVAAGVTYLITKKSNNKTFTLTSDTPNKFKFPKPPTPRFIREDTYDKIAPKEKTTTIPKLHISEDILNLNNITSIRVEGSSDIIVTKDKLICIKNDIIEKHGTMLIIKTKHTNVVKYNKKIFNTYYDSPSSDSSDSESSSEEPENDFIPNDERIITLQNFSSGLHLDGINLKGSGSIVFDGLKFNHELVTILQGSGDIKFYNCEMYDAGMELNGSGDIVLDSKCIANILSLVVKGSGDITIQRGCKINGGIRKNIKGSGDINILTKYKIV